MTKKMLAEEMYNKAIEVLKPLTDNAYNNILLMIRNEANKGNMSLSFDISTYGNKVNFDIIVHRLRQEGFKAKIKSDNTVGSINVLHITWDMRRKDV